MKEKLLIETISHHLINKESNIDSNTLFQLKLIDNQQQSLLTILNKLINDCDEFYICVAFIKNSGLQSIKLALANANQKNIPAKIIVGNKDNFSDPKAIRELNKFNNIQVKLNMNNNLHTKGYFFRKDDVWTIIIGSSNLTGTALKTNEEWNMIINSLDNGKLVEEALFSFNILWQKSSNVNEVIEAYQLQYNLTKEKMNELKKHLATIERIEPNTMQIKALQEIEKTRKTYHKALIISATGTGKTYLAAFDVERVKPKKLLFVVHRENIARNAMQSFKRIIDKDILMGEFIGSNKTNMDYLFSTIQTISKDENLHKFNSDEFDYIIIDEVHRAGATSYQKILNYFKPKFLLGLTATPERMDGFNIYELFDYNIAYEIRLNEAIKNDIIVPFHYYGVNEVIINNKIVDEKTKVDLKEKASNIKEKSEFYNYDGNKVHGLIFVDNVEHAKKLSIELNLLGYKTIALTGEDNENKRVQAINLLQQENTSLPYLDFIISVDIFNEGIDIPYVNQVLLLRPTKSVIIYIQQLGRGLRKAQNKNYLVILDFIGNYKNNFLIPVALSGDSTFDIDYLNRFITNGSDLMPGTCTINFEEIARKQVLDKIDKKNFQNKNLIEHDYLILKQRLNRMPLLSDFYDQKMISPEFILNYKKTYPEVVKAIDKDYHIPFNEKELKFLKYLYQEFNTVKRIHEIIIIREFLKKKYTLNSLNNIIEDYLGINNQIENTTNALNHLEKKIFTKDNTRIKYDALITNGELDLEFKNSYLNNNEFKQLIDDFINFNLNYNKDYYKQINEKTLIIGKNYSRKEVFHLMNLDYHAAHQVGGYVVIKNENKVIIFIKADKSTYHNEFFNQQEFSWYSKAPRVIGKSETETLIAENKMVIEVFVKKEIGEKEYYLGCASVISYEQIQINNKPVIKYILGLDKPIDDSLFNYFNY